MMQIEEKLDEIFKCVGIDFEKNKNLRKENLLGVSIGLKARDLLIVYFMIENEFKIQIPEESIVNGEFNSYWNILEIIRIENRVK